MGKDRQRDEDKGPRRMQRRIAKIIGRAQRNDREEKASQLLGELGSIRARLDASRRDIDARNPAGAISEMREAFRLLATMRYMTLPRAKLGQAGEGVEAMLVQVEEEARAAWDVALAAVLVRNVR